MSCRRLIRSIERTRAASAAWSTGFVRYSSPPASSPATTSFESAIAVTMMIGVNGNVGVGAQAPAYLDAVELGHHDVEQDQVRRMLPGGRQALLAVGRGDDLVALGEPGGSAGP